MLFSPKILIIKHVLNYLSYSEYTNKNIYVNVSTNIIACVTVERERSKHEVYTTNFYNKGSEMFHAHYLCIHGVTTHPTVLPMPHRA